MNDTISLTKTHFQSFPFTQSLHLFGNNKTPLHKLLKTIQKKKIPKFNINDSKFVIKIWFK